VFALLAGLCWLSARLARRMTAQAPGSPGAATAAAAAPGTGGSGLLVKALPYLTVVIAAFAPLAAGVYLLTSLAWSLAERKFFWPSAVASAVPEVPANQRTVKAR
jgi:YidC/Oxa1 family membrane protein insertase